MRELEYRRGNNEDGKYKIGLFVAGTDVCLMLYNGFITGRNGDILKLYPNRRGEGVMGVIRVPMKHSISIYLVRNGGMKNEGNYM